MTPDQAIAKGVNAAVLRVQNGPPKPRRKATGKRAADPDDGCDGVLAKVS
jgi:hypothetical protein